jgi:SpoVK/Ycf46/Vps4 family AAA+-type ATPase
MRSGFTILFHGSPGTGKTEAVKQLAKETKREVMHVDLSKTRSKWFGESEKNIAEIFAQYRQLKRNSKLAPILLFNEADGIFGSRTINVDSSSAQISNTIQNVLLEEMENFEGIMVATTNLTRNFDKAFERRFLYKIEFSKPDAETKKQIWLSKIPDISTEIADQLAQEFDFSGGQIENVSRKLTIDTVLSDIDPSYETLVEYCNEELINKKVKRSMGFSIGAHDKAS